MNLDQLFLKAQTHLGHPSGERNKSMNKFIYATRNGIDIIDVRQSIYHLKIAQRVIQDIVSSGGHILYHLEDPNFGKVAQPLLPKGSSESMAFDSAGTASAGKKADKQLYICKGNWMGGLLTNWDDIQAYVLQKENFYRRNSSLVPEKLQKRKAFRKKFQPLLNTLPQQSKSLPSSFTKPSLVITFNSLSSQDLLAEAWKSQIPSIAIVDTDCNPSKVSYPIPGNDDSLKSFFLYSQILFSPFFTNLLF